MLRRTQGARRFNHQITLAKATVTTDDYGHPSVGTLTPVLKVYASVRQMSATKTMLTFQQADIIGLDIDFRSVNVDYNCIIWEGHVLHFSQPESIDMRGWLTHITAWYHIDNPSV